jgi:1,4-dihydroxy-2-naphthoyl-CoA hydrolase
MDDPRDAAMLVLPPDIEEEFLSVGVRLRALTSGGALGGRLGINISEARVERVVGTLPVYGNTQPRGLLHGGASAILAETLGSIGAMLHARTSRMPVGVELNCTHHRGVRKGEVTGVAVPIHLGRTIATHEIVITDDDGRRICTARLTCLLKDVARPDPAQRS